MSAEVVAGIVEVLEQAEYRGSPQPLHVADLRFDFDAVLTGPREQGLLVLVKAAEGEEQHALYRHLRALALALERGGSSRPAAVVLVAAEVPGDLRERIEELARLLVIVPGADPEALREGLLELLPLALPPPIAPPTTGDDSLGESLGALRSDPLARRLLRAARSGAREVERAFLEHLEKEVTP